MFSKFFESVSSYTFLTTELCVLWHFYKKGGLIEYIQFWQNWCYLMFLFWFLLRDWKALAFIKIVLCLFYVIPRWRRFSLKLFALILFKYSKNIAIRIIKSLVWREEIVKIAHDVFSDSLRSIYWLFLYFIHFSQNHDKFLKINFLKEAHYN